MKQVYFFLFAMLVGTFASAQELMPVQAAKEKLSFKKASITPAQIDRDAFWSNDCNVDNCSTDWVFDNGSDIAGSPWYEIDINFECSTDGPSGPYNQWAGGTGDGSAAGSMNSTTSANGTLMIDSDLFGADANYDAAWIENSWVQTANPIDCSSEQYVSISIETRYRCWDNGASDDSEKCLIEISRDGTTWPDIATFSEAEGTVDYGDGPIQSRWEVFTGFGTGDQSDNPSIKEFDITSAAGGQETVYIRFRWSGTWGYSWEIDDIQLYQTPENDTRIDNYLSYTDYERTLNYEYGAWAQSQIPDNLQAAAKVYNVGFAEQTGVTLELDVNGAANGSDAITLQNQQNDTLSVLYQPAGLGEVNLSYTLFADVEDENPGNNTAQQSFTVTDYSFGRDDGFINYASPAGDEEGTIDYIALSLYDIVADVEIYGIDVAIMEGSEEYSPVTVHLFDGLDSDFLVSQYGGILVSSDEVDLNANFLNTPGEEIQNWYRFIFDEPYSAAPGDFIGAGFEHYGGSNVQYGESKYTQDQTAFVFGPFGSGTYDWYYTNDVPMIRLNLDPNSTATPPVDPQSNVSEVITNTSFQLYPSYPNPTNGVTNVKYSLDFASKVTFEMRDITGKVVYSIDMGTQAAGMNKIAVNAIDFAAGAYTYTITVNGERATDRLLVK